MAEPEGENKETSDKLPADMPGGCRFNKNVFTAKFKSRDKSDAPVVPHHLQVNLLVVFFIACYLTG